ncbi:MAG: UbiA prenyltransferase family protein [Terriglobia bacterium]
MPRALDNSPSSPRPQTARKPGSLIWAHLQIARIDHWTKNVFVLPGIIIPLLVEHTAFTVGLMVKLAVGILSVCLVASSNYVLNEILDAPFDRFHPSKRSRPVVQGRVSIPLAYAQWITLMTVGMVIAWHVSKPLAATDGALWLMGCTYNIPPIRSKDLPFFDVLSESVNNPLRLLAGWYMVTTSLIPPASLLLSYWMVGGYFMAIKRFSEFRELGGEASLRNYRKSFKYYSERRLLVSIMFYASTAMLFLGAFIMRYRLELILSFPFLALVMAVYLNLAFEPGSVVQNPERLHRAPVLMVSVILCVLVMIILLSVNLPKVHQIFRPTLPNFTNDPG